MAEPLAALLAHYRAGAVRRPCQSSGEPV